MTKRVVAHIPDDLYHWLVAKAGKEMRSMSQAITKIITDAKVKK